MSKELLTLIFNYTLAICDPNEKRSFGEIKELKEYKALEIKLKQLEEDEAELNRLYANGVDNWDGYNVPSHLESGDNE